MAEMRTTFPIAADAATVWGILVDFERWSEWNPSVPSISGDARLGSTVALTLAMPRRPSAKVKATITELVPERRFCWHGTVGGDRVLKLAYKGGEQTIDLSPNVTVVTLDKTTPDQLAPGRQVFVIAHKGTDGTLTANGVVVGAEGVKPPM